MRNSRVNFKHPVCVLQVFRNINVYGKDKRSFEDRKEDMEWKEFHSKSGFVRDGQFYLPETILHLPHFQNGDLITLEDSMQQNTSEETNECFYLHHPNPLHIFELKKEEELVLLLKYGYFEVGAPKRNDFKLCELKLNEPVEIKINGKTDASLTSGRERKFKEQFYIFQFLGQFSECTILREPFVPFVKQVPRERKEVDLLKRLW